MKTSLTIAQREVVSYFSSPAAYVVLVVWLVRWMLRKPRGGEPAH